MRDLIKLSQRIGQIVPDETKRVQQTYDFLTSDPFCVTALKHLSPLEIVKICFLIYETKRRNVDPTSLLSELENIFIFSTIYFSGEIKHSCYDCGGDGYTRCGECDGGTISCDNCDGEGTINDGEDACGECDGTGFIDCQECDGGYVDCQDCDGQGEITQDGLEYTLKTYISYSNKLKKAVRDYKSAMQSLSIKFVDNISDNFKTINLRDLDSEDDNINSSFESDTYINNFKDSNEIDYLEMHVDSRSIRIFEDDMEEVNREFY